jgi:hypothetical protein
MTRDQIDKSGAKQSYAYGDSMNLWVQRMLDHEVQSILSFFQNFKPTGDVDADMMRYCSGSSLDEVVVDTKAATAALKTFGFRRMEQIRRELDRPYSIAFQVCGPDYERQLTLELQVLERILAASSVNK